MDLAAVESRRDHQLNTPPADASLAARFAAVVRSQPDRIAITWQGRSRTYGELQGDVAQLSGAIGAALPERSPTRIALLLDDRLDQLTALLAVWHAGHAWVPVDVRFPVTRQRAMVADADPGLILAESCDAALALAAHLPALTLAASRSAVPAKSSAPVAADALAYILYTSGSTGVPKGVMQTHGTLGHHARKYIDSLGLGPADRLTWLPGFTFAAAITDILGALLSGAALLPFDLRARGTAGLAAWLAAEHITLYHSVPTVFRRLADTLPPGFTLPELRFVRLSGETLFPQDVERFRRHFSKTCRLVHALGSTELNLIRQMILPPAMVISASTVPVGYAVHETEVLILDDDLRPVPDGTTGEIVVRSRHLSPGYWRQPQVSVNVFLADPAGGGWRRFRTGDLGRRAADGCLTHLGRRDERFKVRGLRVEPAEIEAALLRTGAYREAVATVTGDVLVAYVVPVTPGLAELEVPTVLADTLPDYMLPARLFALAEFPRLPNGKVDRRELAARPLPASARAAPLEPRDAVDIQLARLWERLFQLRGLDRGAHFFALGGHSLLAAELFAAIQKTFDVDLPLATLLRAPTLEALADVIRARGPGAQAWSPLVNLQPLGDRPPLFIVPGAGTDVLNLRVLAAHLAPHQPLVGIQHQGVRDPRRAHRSIADMARYYVDAVRGAQPQGPYLLGGVSFGGLIAYEMAVQLREAGAEVGLVLLLDTYAPGYPRRRPNPTLRRRALHLLRACLPLADRETLTWPHFREGLREHAQDVRAAIAIRVPWRRRPPSPLMRLVYQKHMCLRAKQGYVMPSFDGRLTLLRATVQPPEALFIPDPLLGWGGLAAGGVDVIPIAGSHNQLIHIPAVHTVVEVILARTARR